MTYTTRIGGGFYLFGISIRATDTGQHIGKLEFGKMSQLIKPDHIIFGTLIPGHIVFAVAVAKLNGGFVAECP